MADYWAKFFGDIENKIQNENVDDDSSSESSDPYFSDSENDNSEEIVAETISGQMSKMFSKIMETSAEIGGSKGPVQQQMMQNMTNNPFKDLFATVSENGVTELIKERKKEKKRTNMTNKKNLNPFETNSELIVWKPSKNLATYLSRNGCYPLNFSSPDNKHLLDDFRKSVENETWDLSESNSSLVTDAFLHMLWKMFEMNPSVNPKRVILTGNIYVTDTGIYWLSKFLEKNEDLQQIILDGCKLVTEKGLLYLCKGRQKNFSISAKVTGIAFQPDSLLSKGIQVLLSHCPLIKSDLSSCSEIPAQNQNLDVGLLVICPSSSTGLSLLDVFYDKINSSDGTRSSKSFLSNIHLSENWKFNLIEISLNDMFASTLIPPEVTQVLIPFDSKSSLEDVSSDLSKSIVHFLSKEVYAEYSGGRYNSKSTFPKQKWTVNIPLSSEVDDVTGIIRNIHGLAVVTMKQSFSRLNPSFVVKIKEIPSDKENTQMAIGVMTDLSKNSTVVNISVKAGDSIKLLVKGSELSTDSYIRAPHFDCFHNQSKIEFPTWPEDPEASVFPMFSFDDCKDVVAEIVDYDCAPAEFVQTNLEKKKFVGNYFTTSGISVDENTGIIGFNTSGIKMFAYGKFFGFNSISTINNEMSFTLKSNGSGIMVGVANELLFESKELNKVQMLINLGTGEVKSNGEEIRLSGEIKCECGDTFKIIFNEFGSFYPMPEEILEMVLLKNDQEIDRISWKYMAEQSMNTKLVPVVVFTINDASVQFHNLSKTYNSFLKSLPLSNSKFLIRGELHDALMKENFIYCKRDLDFSSLTLSVCSYRAGNSLTRDHPYFEIILTKLDERKLVGIGLMYSKADLKQMVGWEAGCIGWHFDNGQIYHAALKGLEVTGCSSHDIVQGDTVGCGFVVKDVVFDDETGLPIEQTLPIYFTHNGQTRFTFEYKCRGGGVFPAIGMVSKGNTVEFVNHFDPIIGESDNATPDENKCDNKKEIDAGGVNFIAICTGGKSNVQPDAYLRTIQDKLFMKLNEIKQKVQNFLLLSSVEFSTFADHQRFSMFCKLENNLERFLSETPRRLHLLALHPQTMKADKKVLFSKIIDIQQAVREWSPYLYNSWSSELLKVVDLIMGAKNLKLLTVDALHAAVDNSKFVSESVFDQLLHQMHVKGQILYFRSHRPQLVVTNTEWFLEMLNNVYSKAEDRAGDIGLTSLEEKTLIWRDRSLLKMALQQEPNKQKIHWLLDLLLENSILVRMKVCRVSREDIKACFLCPGSLKLPPSSPENFTTVKSSEVNRFSAVTTYSLPLELPLSVWKDIIAICCQFVDPTLIWENGIVFFHGHIEMVIWVVRKNQTVEIFLKASAQSPEVQDIVDECARDNFQNTLMTSWMLFSDLLTHVFIKNELLFDVSHNTNVNSEIKNLSSIASCYKHRWQHMVENDYSQQLSVCTLCGNCSEKGMSCDFNLIPGNICGQCVCHTQVACCLDCGICKSCAEHLWAIKCHLRPCCYGRNHMVQSETGEEKTLTIRQVLHLTSWNEIELISLQNLTQMPRIILNSQSTERKELYILAYPGEPLLFDKDTDHSLKKKIVLDAKCLEEGDRIQLQLKEPMLQFDSSSKKKIKDVEKSKRYHFHIQNCIRVWHKTGQIFYDGPPTVDVGLLAAEQPFSPEAPFFEIEILDTGDRGTITVGAVRKNYPYGQQPGWTSGSIGYHADDGGIYVESGWGAKERQQTCTVGDRMGCGVENRDGRVFVYFTKNGEKVIEKQFGFNMKDLYPAIGMHSEREAARILTLEPWRSNTNAKILNSLEAFENDEVKILPLNSIKFSSTNDGKEKIGKVFIQNKSDHKLLFKIKMNTRKEYKVEPKTGEISPGSKDPVEICFTLNKESTDMSKHKMTVQYILIPPGSEDSLDLKNLWKEHEQKINTSYKVGCELEEDLDESDSTLSEPQQLSKDVDRPPTEPSYLVEIFKNGEKISSFYIPRLEYSISIDHNFEDFNSYLHVNCPNMPLEVLCGFHEGQILEAEMDKHFVENIDSLYASKLLAEALEESCTTVYAECLLVKANLSKSYSLVVPVGGNRNKLRWIKFDATFDQLHPVGWFEKNFSGVNVTHENATLVSTSRPSELIVTVHNNYVFLRTSDNTLKDISVKNFIPDMTGVTVDKLGLIDYGLCCSSNPFLIPVQKATLAKHSIMLKDWSSMSTLEGVSHDPIEMERGVYIHLPRELTYKLLCYPQISQLMDTKSFSRHQICKDTTRNNSKYGAIYQNIHFVNSNGAPSNQIDCYFDAISSRAYCELATTKTILPKYDKLINGCGFKLRAQVEHLMQSLLEKFALTCQMLTAIDDLLTFKNSLNNTKVPSSSVPVDISDDNRDSIFINGCCVAHGNCKSGKQEFSLQLFEPFGELLTSLQYSLDGIVHLHNNLPSSFANVEILEFSDTACLESLFDDIYSMSNLKQFIIGSNNKLQALPADIGDCPALQYLKINRSFLDKLPNSLGRCRTLVHLDLRSCQLQILPENFGDIRNLLYLDLSSNHLSSLPKSFANLKELKTLKLSGVQWFNCEKHYELYYNGSSEAVKKIGDNIMASYATSSKVYDQASFLAELNANIFSQIPHLGQNVPDADESGGIPIEIFALKSLEELQLDYQSIHSIPAAVGQLINLHTLSLSNCPLLESLSGPIGELSKLKSLNLHNCPSLRTPPNEVVSRGTESVFAYLKKMAGGFTKNWRTKLMLVGLGGAGKTSLLKALMSDSGYTDILTAKDTTDGIDINTWTVPYGGKEITYSAWDFAGQTVYYNTHQFFLSKRAVYLLLWTTRLGFEHAGLDFWLSSIKCHAPDAPIFVVGTHTDLDFKQEIPTESLKKNYPQITGFHFVSSTEGRGIAELKADILKTTIHQKNMGEKVPHVYLKFEEEIVKERDNKILSWEKVQQIGLDIGIYDEDDIKRAVLFLHDLGTLQYFDNEFLRKQIIIDPQWIVNVMKRVVSAKDSLIKDGRFMRDDREVVWKDHGCSGFPDIFDWLLRLTEEFDLTFPLPKEPINIVPCLLPETEPPIDWKPAKFTPGFRETFTMYQFAFLPASLFNRAQVRLCHLSDGSSIWKRGSLLQKNQHQAIIKQTSDKEMLVKVQGDRPENILFLVHEVIETLIAESFHGISYEYLIPCPDCLENCSADQKMSLFKASLIRQAKQKGVPFLQCRRQFHTVSMMTLEAIMPPDRDSISELDIHLANSLHNLSELRNSMSTDIFISYCSANDDDRQKALTIRSLLEKHFTCCFEDETNKTATQDIRIAMDLKTSKLLLVMMSNDYEKDDHCRKFYQYATKTLNKPFHVIAIGQNFKWQETEFGGPLAQLVFTDMVKYDVDKKIGELIRIIETKILNITQSAQIKDCFISYAWKNSDIALKSNSKTPGPGWIGYGDPRKMKEYLESKGISCWIDIEQASKDQSGLFASISAGFKEAKVVVACISKEYAESVNCMMEFRHATLNLKKPIVFAVVGTGKEWKKTEIGLLNMRKNPDKTTIDNTAEKRPKVNFQVESKDAYERLYEFVKKAIIEARESETDLLQATAVKQKSENGCDNRVSFNEEYELVQRKFLRYIADLASDMNTVHYPRLFIVDFVARKTPVSEGIANVKESANSRNRPSTVSKKMTLNLANEQWLEEDFCVKLICEHEEGWHYTNETLPFAADSIPSSQEKKQFVCKISPFLHRMYTLLDHSSIKLDLFSKDVGREFVSFVEKQATVNAGDLKAASGDFKAAYSILRKHIMHGDPQRIMGNLKRCHYPTGQIRWLCNDHSKGSRITILSSDIIVAARGQPLVTDLDIGMLKLMKKRGLHQTTDLDEVDGLKPVVATKLATQKRLSKPSAISSVVTTAMANSNKGKTAKEKWKAAGLVAQTASNWPNQPTSSKACVIL